MGAEWPHGLALAGDAGPADLVQSLGLYQRESHLPVRQGVLGQVNSLLTALAAEPLDLVTVVAKGGGWCICRRAGPVVIGAGLGGVSGPSRPAVGKSVSSATATKDLASAWSGANLKASFARSSTRCQVARMPF